MKILSKLVIPLTVYFGLIIGVYKEFGRLLFGIQQLEELKAVQRGYFWDVLKAVVAVPLSILRAAFALFWFVVIFALVVVYPVLAILHTPIALYQRHKLYKLGEDAVQQNIEALARKASFVRDLQADLQQQGAASQMLNEALEEALDGTK